MAATTTQKPEERQEPRAWVERQMLADLLDELFPDGLTADAPRAKAKQQASA